MNRKQAIRIGIVLVVLGVLSWLAPVGFGDPPDREAIAANADTAYASGDFETAQHLYMQSYALCDPLGDVTPRARFAASRARALVRWARLQAPGDPLGEGLTPTAERWIDIAAELDVEDGRLHFIRGLLFDPDGAPMADREKSLFAYRAFVAWAQDGDPQAGGREVGFALERIEALR